jgi:biofilm PGA synthesis N-glycosyltransferase PgaC
MASLAAPRERGRPRIYITVRAKFAIALIAAFSWVMLSILLSRPWMTELGAVTHPLFALFAITFIAYVPGFMNTFLVTSLLLDRRPGRRQPAAYPPVTILVAAYEEERAIGETIRSIARSGYPGRIELLVLNDGSTDGTADIARNAIGGLDIALGRDFQVVDFKTNRGKSAVLNDGLRRAKHELIVTVDGDSLLHPGALTRLVERFLSDPDHTQAVAGAILVRNSRDNIITGAQEWDYFHGIAAVKRMQSLYQGTLVAQGAFSLYRRDALNAVGGWQDVVGEDIVLSWAMLDKGYRIGYAEDAIAWTNAPATFRQFARQRQRWSRGLVEALNQHEALLFKPRLTQMFIWWNLLFLPLDFTYTFIFIPGVVAALVFQIYWVAGLMTLAVIPIALLWNGVIFREQARMFREQGLKVRHNPRGLIFYLACYALMMQPICVWGYAVEALGLRKSWGTK